MVFHNFLWRRGEMNELETKDLLKADGWYWCRRVDEEEYFPVAVSGGEFWCPDANIHVKHKSGHGGWYIQGKLEAVIRDEDQELRWVPMDMKIKKLKK